LNRGRWIVQPVGDVLPESGHFLRQLVRAPRRFAEPEGQRRWLSLGICHANLPRLDFDDLVRRVAELKDVARRALDREVLVNVPTNVSVGSRMTR